MLKDTQKVVRTRIKLKSVYSREWNWDQEIGEDLVHFHTLKFYYKVT